MNIIVNGAILNFVNGKLVFRYYEVSASIGELPNRIEGLIQMTSEQGVSIDSTEQEVIDATKAFIVKMSSEEAPVYPGLLG